MPARLALALAVLLAAGPAMAAPNPVAVANRKAYAAIAVFDRNGKGYVSLDDFLRGRGMAGRVFGALDLDGNGTIERAEFLRGGGGASRAATFARLDRKKTGHVTQAELVANWNKGLFDALSHGSGFLTAGDLRPGLSRLVSAPAAPPPRIETTAATAPSYRWCWIPITGKGGSWQMIFPWQFGCR
jgi:hypothetical protein